MCIRDRNLYFGQIDLTLRNAYQIRMPIFETNLRASLPSSDSTHICPPCLSTIFLQIASPMPVPGYSSFLCSLLKTSKIFPEYCGSIPIPLSCTENNHSLSFFSAEI